MGRITYTQLCDNGYLFNVTKLIITMVQYPLPRGRAFKAEIDLTVNTPHMLTPFSLHENVQALRAASDTLILQSVLDLFISPGATMAFMSLLFTDHTYLSITLCAF